MATTETTPETRSRAIRLMRRLVLALTAGLVLATAVVVFEGGGLGLGTDWAKVAPEVAKFARACTYDRSGRGWSERSPDERTAANIADELATLLERAGEK